MVKKDPAAVSFPSDPLENVTPDDDYRRRSIIGVIDSYNGSYDFLSEAVQNSIDAVEDAIFKKSAPPHKIDIFINLMENFIGVLDTGIGMSPDQILNALAPNVSFKGDNKERAKFGSGALYRGHKGVGLTFLAYGCDDVRLHSKTERSNLIKTRMRYGRSWAENDIDNKALVVEDLGDSPLEKEGRGTYVQIHLSSKTRPRMLSRLAAEPKVWESIVRTRTAAGQILMGSSPIANFDVNLIVTDTSGEEHRFTILPSFLMPHTVKREPAFRFLNLTNYWSTHGEHSDIRPEAARQDGIYISWDSSEIRRQLTDDQRNRFEDEIRLYNPHLYAFLPYQAIIWRQINEQITGVSNRRHLIPGLMIGINRQRLADLFEINPTRFETLSRNLFALVHFIGAKPDQGRKTVQDEVLELAQRAADRALQYLSRQRQFLKPSGDSPTPDDRAVEKNHEDWSFNVRSHAQKSPLHLPPLTYGSEPLAEQDVVGLFHQLSVVGVFPGVHILATSQQHTYDCLVRYEVESSVRGLQYRSENENALGISPYVLGDSEMYTTKYLTMEFKNNLDQLISDCDSESPKSFLRIDLCVCWATVSEGYKGYILEQITDRNVDERRYPGATHILRKDGESHSIQVVFLKEVIRKIESGAISLV